MIQRGIDHEAAYVDALEKSGREIIRIKRDTPERGVEETVKAMRDGADVIVQGALRHEQWFGYADIIVRVDKKSDLGNWAYEVADTKLARETRAGTILQLGLYSSMVESIQGKSPEQFHVVVPGAVKPQTVTHSYRVDDFSAFVRLIQRELTAAVAGDHEALGAAHYPDPVEHCEYCGWWRTCDTKRHDDDHLSLVAGLPRLHRRELARQGITTVAGLAGMEVPIAFKPKRGSRESFERAREQALVQLQSRGQPTPTWTLRTPPRPDPTGPPEPYGLGRLPTPSSGDVFLDLEGDLFADEGGREYLFGIATVDDGGEPQYRAWWGISAHDERVAFEEVMDFIMDRLARHPDMHVYHYAPYEPSAFKRLMGRHATREKELDRLLTGRRFIDLYAVVRQAMWIGVESYSIKQLEPAYGFTRGVELPNASPALRRMEYALQTNRADLVPDEDRAIIEGYNRDDCLSTVRLREWLERIREEAELKGIPCPRPPLEPPEQSEEVKEKDLLVQALRERLLARVPEDRDERTEEQHARWLLSYLLDYHRRENKATWWEYFRLRDLPDEDLADEPKAITGLQFAERVSAGGFYKNGKPKGPIIDRYSYPEQEMDLYPGAELRTATEGKGFARVLAVDRVARTIDLRKSLKNADIHPTAVFEFSFVPTEPIESAIFEFGELVAEQASLEAIDSCAAQLLLGRPPRLKRGAFQRRQGESELEFAVRVVQDLDRSVLPIQGPPGAGKTFTGAHMICALVNAGLRVGVTANSHKVIRKLLQETRDLVRNGRQTVALAHRDDEDPTDPTPEGITLVSNEGAAEGIHNGTIDVLGGTAWLWSRDDLREAVDVLFLDEAGQMALANVVAVARGARSLVLLGDPQQLDQPQKGTHPDGVAAPALEHLLGGRQTMPDDHGIFLPTTWRMPSSLSAFTSEVYYERRLASEKSLEQQRLLNAGMFDGAGLWCLDVDHDANRNQSVEEVDVVVNLVQQLTTGAQWTDAKGRTKPLGIEDILIVSPYNSQVNRLRERLPAESRVGTVDRFQGQEAPVVIYSMATSRPEDAPRGLEFLYNPNRLNVATSRARCAVILVASPHLYQPECRSVKQIRLANGLCRFRELATLVLNHRIVESHE
jgi:predicted RecB family nuclease